MQNRTFKIIGLVGGIGSGKSTISKIFTNLGAELIDADKMCHNLLSIKSTKDKIVEIWPDAINNDNNTIDRKKLAAIVFSKPEKIKLLNNILHPIVTKQIKERIEELKNKKKIIIIDAALLLEETALASLCDTIIFIETETKIRKKRCMDNRYWNEGEIERRERFQISLKKKMQQAHFVINNNGSLTDTIKQTNNIWNNFLNIQDS